MPPIVDLYRTLEYGPAPESPAPARKWLSSRDGRFGHFIGGEWTLPAEGGHFPTRNPATGEELARVALGSPADVDRAVAAATEALEPWTDRGPGGRARVLYALARTLQRHSRLFAVLESLDNGKPIRESRDLDVPLAIRHLYHHAGWARLLEEEFPGRVGYGVVGQIIPWNFPLLMLAWKVAPALAAGSTVVLKPAEHTPLTALLFAELTREAGVPPGVVNVVTGDGTTGAALVAHPGIGKLAFTGSTEVGREIREATADRGTPLTLELGGKSPFLVFEDADLDSAVEGVVDAIWFNQGQVCCAGSRILAQEGIAPRLEERLRARMETLRMGDPLDKGVDLGAITAPVQLERIRRLVEQGREEGARIWQPSWALPEEGLFYPPTLCTGVEPAGTLDQVEIFGPVVTLSTFRTPDEAVTLANHTRYGLAASIWTESVSLALEVAPRLKAGTVWVNCTNLFDAASGFGGYRESGFGREGGREGMDAYLRPAWEVARPPRGARALRPGSRLRLPLEGGLDDPARGGDGGRGRGVGAGGDGLDRTAKLYVGGKQVRPDGGLSLVVEGPGGQLLATVPRGNRKDVRNAVEAARKAAPGWGIAPAHLRAQVLYYLAENLSARAGEFAHHLREGAGYGRKDAELEVELTLDRFFRAAARADKWEGRVHETPFRNVTLAMVEPLGVLGIVCPGEAPLLALASLVGPALATGNTVVVVPSPAFPLPALDLYQVLDTSDVPPGVVNLVSGLPQEVVPTLADHDDVDGIWAFGDPALLAEVRRRSAGNLKRTWTPHGRAPTWTVDAEAAGEDAYRHATQVKNVWVPYGV
jgi:aldehyde dehydrogenase (NAD+)